MVTHSLCSTQFGGKYVINPSGGLEAKGHPLGATGLGMHFYITSTCSKSSFAVRLLIQFQLLTVVQLRECAFLPHLDFICDS
jgi:hypothetical protein